MNARIFEMIDQLLRAPDSVAQRSRSGEDLRPLFIAALLSLILGAGVFGAVLATSTARGALPMLYSGVKLPFAVLSTLVLVVPAFFAIARGLGRSLTLNGAVGLTLAATGRAALVLFAFAPLVWLAFDRGLSYHKGVLLAGLCYTIAGFAALRVVLSGVGSDRRGYGIVLCSALVLLPTGAQTAWMLRPFLGRPSQEHVPFLRAREASFADSVYQSARSAAGIYDYVSDVKVRRKSHSHDTGAEIDDLAQPEDSR